MTRDINKQLQTQRILLGLFDVRLARTDIPDEDRAKAERGKTAAEARIANLEQELSE